MYKYLGGGTIIKLLKIMAEFINNIHDEVVNFVGIGDYAIDDKKLHFISMAIIGMAIFTITQFVFKRLAKYSITAISFIYTFTVMIVIVFVIEIQQKLTNRGNMEFADIAYGIYGFLYVFLIYLVIKLIFIFAKKQLVKLSDKKTNKFKDTEEQ